MAELFKMKLLDVNKNQILPETSADQVTMAGGGNVEAKIKSLESAFAAGTRLLGTVGSGGTVETLPADSYQLGDMYVVKTAGTYASQVCEPGDLILCIKAYAEEGAADTDWTVILPETSADQVKTADGSNVETKLASLQTAVSGKVPCYVVNDIAARDGLESPKQGDLCWVKDATADATVSTGAAQYIYDGSAWVKIAEAESMDLVINWADIQGKEAVEAAMGKAHEHANADLLNGISASGDTMTVNGKTYYSGRMVAIIENGAEIPADMNPNGIVFEKAAV